LGQDGRHGHQPQGGELCLETNQFKGFVKGPKALRKTWIDQKNFHRDRMGIFAMLREMPRIIKRNIGQPENWGCSIKKSIGFPK
jgi:hypothetical protein